MTTKIFVSQIDSANNTGGTADVGSIITLGATGAYWGPGAAVGFQGSLGGTGYQGSRGDAGYTGSQGVQGNVGDMGPDGYQGSQGFTGSRGDTGYTGSAGAAGGTGGDGYTGSKGDIGYTGSAGAAGNLGYTGSAGAGYTGSKGDIGYTGSTGSVGAFTNLSDVPASYSGKALNFVRVNSGATGLFFDSNTYVTNGFVTDTNANNFVFYNPRLQSYTEKVNDLGNSGSSKTIAWKDGNIVKTTLTSSVVSLTLPYNLTSGISYSLVVYLKQDATGSRTVDWSNVNYSVKWPSGEGIGTSGPTLSTTANYTDVITFASIDGGATWFGYLSGKGFPTT